MKALVTSENVINRFFVKEPLGRVSENTFFYIEFSIIKKWTKKNQEGEEEDFTKVTKSKRTIFTRTSQIEGRRTFSIEGFILDETNVLGGITIVELFPSKEKDNIPEDCFFKLDETYINKNDSNIHDFSVYIGLPCYVIVDNKNSEGKIICRGVKRNLFKHNAYTLEGSCGAPVVNTETLEVIGVHFWGKKDLQGEQVNCGGFIGYFLDQHNGFKGKTISNRFIDEIDKDEFQSLNPHINFETFNTDPTKINLKGENYSADGIEEDSFCIYQYNNKTYLAYYDGCQDDFYNDDDNSNILIHDLIEDRLFKKIQISGKGCITKVKYYKNIYNNKNYLLTHDRNKIIIVYSIDHDFKIQLRITDVKLNKSSGFTMIFFKNNDKSQFDIIIGSGSQRYHNNYEDFYFTWIYDEEGNEKGNLNLDCRSIIYMEVYYIHYKPYILISSYYRGVLLYDYQNEEIFSQFMEGIIDDEGNSDKGFYNNAEIYIIKNKIILLTSSTNIIRLWDFQTNELVYKITTLCYDTPITLWNEKYLVTMRNYIDGIKYSIFLIIDLDSKEIVKRIEDIDCGEIYSIKKIKVKGKEFLFTGQRRYTSSIVQWTLSL